jgi:hypothetical protein
MIAEQNKELTEKLNSLNSNTNPDETLKLNSRYRRERQ